MFKPPALLLSAVLLGTTTCFLAKADISIIANKSMPIDTIETETAKKLWLGKIHKLPVAGKVKVVDQSGISNIKEDFYKKLANKDLNQLKTYWAKIIFTGKSVPPKTLSSDIKVLDIVRKNTNTLGYVNSKSVTGDVKVLMTIK